VERNQRHTHDVRFLQKLADHFNITPRLLGLADRPAEPMEPPVNRRQFISGAAATLAAATLPRLDTYLGEPLTDIRSVTATYRRLDSSLSSHDLVRPVAAHLDMAHGLLQRSMNTSTRTWLAQSVSESASLLAWLAWDRADYATADHYYREAIKLADLSNDPLLTAYQLGSLATFMIDQRDRKAIDVLRLARHTLGSRPPAIADSWIASSESLAYATMGFTDAAWSALDRAEVACLRIGDQSPPWPWVFNFGHDKIATQRVVCAARLGEPERVLSSPEHQSQPSGTHRRQDALFSLDLAEIYIQAGDTNHGCELATASLQKVDGYRSGRVLRRASDLRNRNAKRLDTHQLEALDDSLRRAS